MSSKLDTVLFSAVQAGVLSEQLYLELVQAAWSNSDVFEEILEAALEDMGVLI